MGREIRRVPPDWEHPRQRCPHSPWVGGCDDAKRNGGQCYHPLFDRVYAEEATKWKNGLLRWEVGEDPDRAANPKYREYWDWHGMPPNRDYHRERAWTAEEATHYQMYETVSEGTPVTPHFATKAELIDYLVEHGDGGRDGGWPRKAAEQFVESEWAPSLIIAEGKMYQPRDGNPLADNH